MTHLIVASLKAAQAAALIVTVVRVLAVELLRA